MSHIYFMQEALKLAKKGWPAVAPNPMVGAVIVANNTLVASGYHQRFGEAHAEVNAITTLPRDVSASECTIYVTLEPCSHQGKTPPCADLLIASGFKKVVIACKDPNPLVAGRGIKKLQDAGVEVLTGILEQEAKDLNRIFFGFHEKKRPYYILKWAITADGFVSRSPIPENRAENLITRKEAQLAVHRLRADSMGIFVGKNTVLKDNPQLTTRLLEGANPVRLFIDRKLEVPADFQIYNTEAPTLVFNEKKEGVEGHIHYIKLQFDQEVLPQINAHLYQKQIQSVLVEGGPMLLSSFIKQDCWDEALVFQNPDLYFEKGIRGPEFPIKNSFELVGGDKLFHHRKKVGLDQSGLLEKEVF